jgi:hypothetical protein
MGKQKRRMRCTNWRNWKDKNTGADKEIRGQSARDTMRPTRIGDNVRSSKMGSKKTCIAAMYWTAMPLDTIVAVSAGFCAAESRLNRDEGR